MQHAILITAYKDLEQLIDLAQCFDSRFNLYIHIDKKTTVAPNIKVALENLSNLAFLSQEFKVNWGGRNHLKSILLLCNKALEQDQNSYFHMITAQDLPIKSNDYFIDHFKALNGKSYLEFFTMPADCWNNGGVDRIDYYNFYDLLNAKTSMHWIQKALAIQKKLGLKRGYSKQLPKLFAGSTYWSLHRDAVRKVATYATSNPGLLKRMKHSFCSEEFYFQTILLNSDLASTLIQGNKRFIVWEKRHGSLPAFLDDSDLPQITQSDALFARKMDHRISASLVQACKQLVNNKP